MQLFDEIHAQQLDRRQMHLTVLASMAIAVLATGVALFMYPAIFAHEILVSSSSLQFAFYGFCLLSVLLVGYLWDRQRIIHRLTEQVRTEQRRNNALRLEASDDLLNMIPGTRGFREQLFAHSPLANSKVRTISVAVVRLYLSGVIAHRGEQQIVLADAVRVIHRRLRKEDSIWALAPGVYGIILAGMDTVGAQCFSASVELGLEDAAGINSRFTSDVQLLTFAGQGKSVRDFERAIEDLLPHDQAAVQD